jgi:putative ABC transport system permease protein
MGASSRLTDEDAAALRTLPGVAFVSPGLRTRAQIVHRGENWNTSIEGTGEAMPAIHAWRLERGAFFTGLDVREAEKVAVLGSAVRDQIFGRQVDPIGTYVRIGIVPVKVIGVLRSRGSNAAGSDQDDTVFVPYTLVQKRLMGVSYLDRITLATRDADDVSGVTGAVTARLRLRHEILPGDADDFRVSNLQEIAEIRTSAADAMTVLLGGIAAVSLVVGGVGVMNVMLVGVTERTREIGLRTAIGAKSRDVLLQFLLEAALLGAAGGALGVLLGVAAARGVEIWLGWPTEVPGAMTGAAFVVSVLIAVGFGLYPAAKAARLDPIDALRAE